MGFKFEKRQAVLLERQDIILWRKNYLQKIRDLRQENAPNYYLDETWVNEGHSETRVWQDINIKSSYEASSSNLTVGLTVPKGKGRRLIITPIGSKEGFVRDAADIFIGKKSGDYHEEMDGNHFEKWFETIMPKLKPQNIIVMDNDPYHSMKKEKIPSWRKNAIQEWLSQKKVAWNQDLIKIELLQKVNEIKHLYDSYKVEEIAKKFGHKILRLPSYHCELNPIEMIWSQVKGYVSRGNKSFKLNKVKELVIKGIKNVSTQNWMNCINHVIKKRERDVGN
ncbi:DDE_3 domain-containing protein [Trichonephila clavata]|uniref:DDE_3 domain-containing protein n=1 Tax=Trichonephila clavata TaxID=2740835 RepID=A0A8X6KL16_TRICU|nr:DDE_3 domain-containing protein [Trichonephila clavata]